MRRAAKFLLLLVLAAACSKSGSTTLPETLCTEGENRCFGNYRGICGESLKEWDLYPCGDVNYCSGGECRPRACVPPGKGTCTGSQALTLCNDLGSAATAIDCAGNETCVGGACLPYECGTGTERCVFDTILTCSGGGWNQAPCPAGKACLGDKCVDKVCAPDEARCSGVQYAGVCNPQGTEFIVTKCGDAEHCVKGFCVPKVANPPVTGDDVPVTEDVPPGADLPDGTVSPEVREDLPAPEAFTPGKNEAYLNDTLVKFDIEHSANWIAKDETLQVTLTSRKVDDVPLPGLGALGANITLEMNVTGLSGVSETGGPTGSFQCQGTATTTVQVWLRYGLHPTAMEGACKDYDFAATTCDFTIDSFGAVGDVVTGTFTNITMKSCDEKDTNTVTIRDGAFSALR